MVEPANDYEAETTDLSSLRFEQNLRELRGEAVELVRRWNGDDEAWLGDDVAESAVVAAPRPDEVDALQWARDPEFSAYLFSLIDTVLRPDDAVVAGRNLERLGPSAPQGLTPRLRRVLVTGGMLGQAAPWVAVPVAQRMLRALIAPLTIPAAPARLAAAIAQLRAIPGATPMVSPLGAATRGDAGATARLASAIELLARTDVDHLLLPLHAVAAGRSPWNLDATVSRIADSLVPLFDLALPSSTTPAKSITLDASPSGELALVIAVFQNILDRPLFLTLSAGITVQSALPESASIIDGLHDWSMARVARGGAPITVRLVKDVHGPLEAVEAGIHSWPRATYDTDLETDTNLKRVLDRVLAPGRMDATHIVVASPDPFDHAFARLLATRRGVVDRLTHELPLGTPPSLVRALAAETGHLVVAAPVLPAREVEAEIEHAAGWLRQQRAGGFEASTDRFPRSLRSLDEQRALDAFDAGSADGGAFEPHSFRTQNRAHPGSILPETTGQRGSTPDTDPSVAANREWVQRVLTRAAAAAGPPKADSSAPDPAENVTEVVPESERPLTSRGVDELVAATSAAGERWCGRGAAERASILRRAAIALEANRDRLIEAMVVDAGLPFASADAEVSRAVDAALRACESGRELDAIDGARFDPLNVVVVMPAPDSPVAAPLGSILSALAAAAGVVVCAHPNRNSSLITAIDALGEGGVPRDLIRLAKVDDELTHQLLDNAAVERVLFGGTPDEASHLRAWRADLPLLAVTGGKNAIIVSPSADLDQAIAAIVESAFGATGHTAVHASLVILIGSVGRSARFRRRLSDAVRSVTVGWPTDPLAQLGPLREPASGPVLDALTLLGPSESWLVEPQKLDDDGRLWSPGLRTGVTSASAFHLVETPAPVIGIMRASTLAEAIVLQNATGFGLAAALHTLDPLEIEQWLAGVEAGTLSVNEPIGGAGGRRQLLSAWRRSSVGGGAASGGPNALVPLGRWLDEPGEPSSDLSLAGLDERVTELLDAATAGLDWHQFDRVRRAALSDHQAWTTWFAPRDLTPDGFERTVLRYLPATVAVRLSDGESLTDLVRVLAAATLAGATIVLSSSAKLPRPLRALLKERQVRVFIESDDLWLQRVAIVGEGMSRIRLIGGDPRSLAEALGASADVAIHPGDVTRSGRIELLPFLREQSVVVTDHRFGVAGSLGALLLGSAGDVGDGVARGDGVGDARDAGGLGANPQG